MGILRKLFRLDKPRRDRYGRFINMPGERNPITRPNGKPMKRRQAAAFAQDNTGLALALVNWQRQQSGLPQMTAQERDAATSAALKDLNQL